MACPHIHACSVQNRCDIVGMNALHGKVYDAVVLLRVLASDNIYIGDLFSSSMAWVVRASSTLQGSKSQGN